MRRLVAVAASLMMAACSAVGIRGGYEEPSYETVQTLEEQVEIRAYGRRTAAQASVDYGNTGENRNRAFSLLYGYIDGANLRLEEIPVAAPTAGDAAGRQIDMTVPVEWAREPDATGPDYRMRFFLPAEYTAESAPSPVDPRVRVVSLPPETLAVLRFSGSRAPEAVVRRKRELLDVLEGSDWRPAADPVAYFYDPPWTLAPLRRNEVAVPVEPR